MANGPGPGDKGTTVGGIIKTPMCDKNVDAKTSNPPTHDYSKAVGSGINGSKGGVSIKGPGEKITWKK